MMIDEVGGGVRSSATPLPRRDRPCKLRGREWKGAGARARHGPRWHGGAAAAGFQLAWIGCGRAPLATYWMHASCMCVWAEGVYVFQKMVRQIF
jgi:hypothetical protein